MKPQIADLFSHQYGIDQQKFAKLMDDFYDHPFQKNKCIRLVALENDIVVGFQSFFYWPYQYNGIAYNSYQSGNSLVHPDYRGKGIFQKLLNFLDDNKETFDIDFLVGFPVEASYNSFIKNNWINPFNLEWHIKIINPLACIFSTKKINEHFEKIYSSPSTKNSSNKFRLSSSQEFVDWRNNYSNANDYIFHNFNDNDHKICFHLKFNKRNKWLNELIIGDIKTNCYDQDFLNKAFKSLSRRALKSKAITAITFATNTCKNNDVMLQTIKKNLFFKLNKSIYFITKPFKKIENISNPENWILYRSDIDTW